MFSDAFYQKVFQSFRQKGFKVEAKGHSHFRINDCLDLYTTSCRWHDIKEDKRGDYTDVFQFVEKFFRDASQGEKELGEDPWWYSFISGKKSPWDGTTFRIEPATLDALVAEVIRRQPGQAAQLPAFIKENTIQDCIEIIHECLTWGKTIVSDPREAQKDLKRAILQRLEAFKKF